MMSEIKTLDMLLINRQMFDEKTACVVAKIAKELSAENLPFEINMLIGIMLADAFAGLRAELFGRKDT